MRTINFFIKRGFDIIGSALGIILLSPFFLCSAILIKLLMPGPAIFRQVRIGKNKKEFVILKFRTMKVDLQAEKSHDVSKDSERQTPFGSLLRRTKIDELLQLVNVFVGDMSLVGPRPTFVEQVEHYTPRQMKRLDMRPGMTGLAQVNGNASISWDSRIEYDLDYVERFSIVLDLRILIKTIGVVILGEEKFAQ